MMKEHNHSIRKITNGYGDDFKNWLFTRLFLFQITFQAWIQRFKEVSQTD